MISLIYFDNAATSIKKPKQVIDSVIYAMNNFGNSSRGVYESTLNADRIIYDTRNKLAKLFNAKNARQVVFTHNATHALNIALNGLFDENEHIITTVTEHNCVLRPLNYLKKNKNISVSYICIDENGNLKLDDIENMICEKTKAIIVNHASNVTGNINDIEKIGKICKKNNLLFIVDCSQTAGAFNIDMSKYNISVLCFTAHKSMLAPQGVGGLCVDENVYIRPFEVGGTGVHSYDEFQPDKMPTRLEAGTLNSHGIAGLNSALDYIRDYKMENLTKKAVDLSFNFYDEIRKLNKIKVYGDFSSKLKAPIVSFNIADVDSAYIGKILSEDYNIATRSGAHCAPLVHKSFNTINQGMVRFSFSHTNTFDELYYAVDAIKKIHSEV